MFLDFYGLNEQPFGATPDPRYLYFSRTHREAQASLWYGIHVGRGFLALVATPGMGKTTLLMQLLERLRSTARTAFLFHTQCDSQQFLRYLLGDLGLDSNEKDPVRIHEQLNELLLRDASENRRVIVIIDEAQNLHRDVLETVRLLSDFETPSQKLIQIILSGQPELAVKLGRPDMAQLRQRIGGMNRLEPLSPSETALYIRHRLQVAGSRNGPIFSTAAMDSIAAHSRGIPRNINTICFNALSLGCALRRKLIGPETLTEVYSDLSFDSFLAESESPILPAARVAPRPAPPPQPVRTAAPLPAVNPSPTPAPVPPVKTAPATAAPGKPTAVQAPQSSAKPVHAPERPADSAPAHAPQPPVAPSAAPERPTVHPAAPSLPEAKTKESPRPRRFSFPFFKGRSLPPSKVQTAVLLVLLAGTVAVSVLYIQRVRLGKTGMHSGASHQELSAGIATAAPAASNSVHAAEPISQPAGSAPAATAPVAEASPEPIDHVVTPNESLGRISLRYLGRFDEKLLQEILALNSRVKNPDHIEVGQRIRIPRGPANPDSEQAPASSDSPTSPAPRKEP